MTEASLHHAIVLGWIGLSVVMFPFLMFLTAPYGRHARSGWGPTIDNRLGWILMEAPAALVIFGFWLFGEHSAGLTPIVLLALWELHYINRAFIFPLRIRSQGKRMPVVVMASGVLFNCVNGYINGRWLFGLSGGYADAWLADPRFWIGAALFLTGYGINLHADQVLMNLRKPGETGYKIPRGGLYRWVTSPNYFGEVIEWTGWAIATWSLPGVAFALWTAANLIPRARDHHKWYLSRFPDYPPERRAVIPLIF